MKLSIAVITMNRAEQLIRALQSCVNCVLPSDTEFVIVDNASTDDTRLVVKDFFSTNNFPYKYEYEKENLGVGGGRNRAFEMTDGDIAYFLDDDAIIAPSSRESFFVEPLRLFEKYAEVASITTRIYDELIGEDRTVFYSKKNHLKEMSDIFMYLGGSHFLRKCVFSKPLYLDIKYGMEEIVPSVQCMNLGMYNCYLPTISIIHQPKVNKWVNDSQVAKSIAMTYNVNVLCSKKLLYPLCLHPILYVFFYLRNFKHFGLDLHSHLQAIRLSKKFSNKDYSVESVQLKTICLFIKRYPIAVVF